MSAITYEGRQHEKELQATEIEAANRRTALECATAFSQAAIRAGAVVVSDDSVMTIAGRFLAFLEGENTPGGALSVRAPEDFLTEEEIERMDRAVRDAEQGRRKQVP